MANSPAFKCARLSDVIDKQHHHSAFIEISNLLNLCFGTDNYTGQFPTVFQSIDLRWSFVLLNNKQIVAFCHLATIHWQHQNGTMLRAACIGSVATHPNFQKQGCASTLLAYAESCAWQARLHGTCLFSDAAEFYAARGYLQVGAEHYVTLTPGNLKFDSKVTIANSISYEFEWIDSANLINTTKLQVAIWNLLSRSQSDCLLSFQDFVTLLQIPQMSVCLLTYGGELCAVGFVGKGIDFQGVLHTVAALTTQAKHRLLFDVVQHLGTLHWLTNPADNPIIECKITSGMYVKCNPANLDSTFVAAVTFGNAYLRGLQSS